MYNFVEYFNDFEHQYFWCHFLHYIFLILLKNMKNVWTSLPLVRYDSDVLEYWGQIFVNMNFFFLISLKHLKKLEN